MKKLINVLVILLMCTGCNKYEYYSDNEGVFTHDLLRTKDVSFQFSDRDSIVEAIISIKNSNKYKFETINLTVNGFKAHILECHDLNPTRDYVTDSKLFVERLDSLLEKKNTRFVFGSWHFKKNEMNNINVLLSSIYYKEGVRCEIDTQLSLGHKTYWSIR